MVKFFFFVLFCFHHELPTRPTVRRSASLTASVFTVAFFHERRDDDAWPAAACEERIGDTHPLRGPPSTVTRCREDDPRLRPDRGQGVAAVIRGVQPPAVFHRRSLGASHRTCVVSCLCACVPSRQSGPQRRREAIHVVDPRAFSVLFVRPRRCFVVPIAPADGARVTLVASAFRRACVRLSPSFSRRRRRRRHTFGLNV